MNGTAKRGADNLPKKYATIDNWCDMSDMGRRAVYDAIGRGDLKAVKLGGRTLIDVEAGLAWMAALPAPAIKAPRERQTVDA